MNCKLESIGWTQVICTYVTVVRLSLQVGPLKQEQGLSLTTLPALDTFPLTGLPLLASTEDTPSLIAT